MKKHIEIRQAALAVIEASLLGSGLSVAVLFDGRPGFIDAKDLPAIAVYISEAKASDSAGTFCDDAWDAILHVEVFLKATSPDTDLDNWTEQLYTAIGNSAELLDLVITIAPQGYDYQRDEEVMTWGSADLQIAITYNL